MKSIIVFLLLITSISLQGQAGSPPEEGGPTTQYYSSGTAVVDLSNRDEIRLSISSPQGFELLRFVDRERVRNNAFRYRGWIPISMQGRYDLTIVHQQFDSLAARGWELVSSNFSMAMDADLSTTRERTIYYHFRIPAKRPIRPSKEQEDIVILRADVSRDVNGIMRGRLLRTKQGNHRLVIEKRLGLSWQTLYELENEGPFAGGMVENITHIELQGNTMSLEVDLPDGVYNYTVLGQGDDFLLAGVAFRANEPCGITSFDIDLTSYPEGRIEGKRRSTPCVASSAVRNFRDRVDRIQIKLEALLPGTHSFKLQRTGTLLTF